jgi:hypothetical protein
MTFKGQFVGALSLEVDLPSNGFMRASLAIVAAAPDAAAQSQSCTYVRCRVSHTGSQRVMFAIGCVTARKLFHNLVGSEVDRMSRPWIMSDVLLCTVLESGYVPAPTMTLLTPRHNVRRPSSLYMVETAFESPV